MNATDSFLKRNHKPKKEKREIAVTSTSDQDQIPPGPLYSIDNKGEFPHNSLLVIMEKKEEQWNRHPQISNLYSSKQKVENMRNKGNKLYKNTHGTVFRRKTNDKHRKKMVLMRKNSKVIRSTTAPSPT